jgi:hypothetical protein
MRRFAGDWIGFLERMLAFVAFWQDELTIVAGWFAFKLAAKWETWKNIVQFPDTLPGTDVVDYLRARNALGSWLLGRFLLGTALNVLIGFVAAFVGRRWREIETTIIDPAPVTATLSVVVYVLCVSGFTVYLAYRPNMNTLWGLTRGRLLIAGYWMALALGLIWIR